MMLPQTRTEPECHKGMSRDSDGETGWLAFGLSSALAQAGFGWECHKWEGRKAGTLGWSSGPLAKHAGRLLHSSYI